MESYDAAYPSLKQDGDFLILYGKALSLNEDYSRAIEILERAKDYKKYTILFTSLGYSYKGISKYQHAEMAI